jgi:thymidine phosphorylase
VLGAGRAQASDAVDFAVGFDQLRKTGAKVEAGEPLLRVHARTESTLEEALRLVAEAVVIE